MKVSSKWLLERGFSLLLYAVFFGGCLWMAMRYAEIGGF